MYQNFKIEICWKKLISEWTGAKFKILKILLTIISDKPNLNYLKTTH